MSILPRASFSLNYYKALDSPWPMVLIAWVYLSLTQCNGLMWFDSGELALAGHSFGLAHPPGQAFYAFLSALSALAHDPLWCLNQLSAIALSLCLYPLNIIYKQLRGSTRSNEVLARAEMQKNETPDPDYCLDFGYTLIALIWVTLYPVWDQGTRIEVYALANLLGLSTLALLGRRDAAKDHKQYFWGGVTLGLCGATQAIFAIAFALASCSAVYSWLKSYEFTHLRKYIAGGLIGFILPHLYMYWVIRCSEGFVWGNWSSWSDILHYFGGNDYVQNEQAWRYVLDNSLAWLVWVSAFGGLTWLCLSLISMIKQGLNTIAYWCLCLFFLAGVFPFTYKAYWPEIPDFSAYLLPCFSLSLLLIWIQYGGLIKLSHKVIFILVLLLGSAWNESPIAHRSRTEHDLPLLMAQNWLENLPQNSLLYLESDHWVFPVMYAQNQLGIRPDVIVFNVGFSRSSWYWHWLKKHHADMPSLQELNQAKSLRTRLSHLAINRNHVYTESLNLAVNLSLQTPLLQSPPCPSSWGYNVSCQSPLPLPKTELIRSWAQIPAHREPITRRVLARLGLNGMQALWSQKKTEEAIDFAMAAIGKEASQEQTGPLAWWPVPPQVWQAAQVGLIGSPEGLEALITSLGQK